ncbi:hypothetical protein HK101_005174 [Irineochytrium annulatum]|nr:hypothetical protein HK101_005174 [Irineochytrium annulatum]
MIDESQVRKAAAAIVNFHTSQAASKKSAKKGAKVEDNPLAEETRYIRLVMSTKKMPERKSVKPLRIPLKHSILAPDAEVCVFTKDPQKEFKALFAEKGIKMDKVLGFTKLKERYHPYEAKRQLVRAYDLFMADQRILGLLPPVLGKAFFKSKKFPVPVNLQAKDLEAELSTARSSAYMYHNLGTCVSVKIATMDHSVDEIVDNAMASIEKIVKHLPGNWDNIRSVNLKSDTSPALPLLNAIPDDVSEPAEDAVEEDETAYEGIYAGVSDEAMAEVEADEAGDSDEDGESDPPPKSAPSKGGAMKRKAGKVSQQNGKAKKVATEATKVVAEAKKVAVEAQKVVKDAKKVATEVKKVVAGAKKVEASPDKKDVAEARSKMAKTVQVGDKTVAKGVSRKRSKQKKD